jgi:DNA primase
MFDDSRLSILNVAAKLGLAATPKTRTEWLARCPMCGDSKNPKHAHLYLNIETNKYYCVRCGTGGFAIGLYARIKGIDTKCAYRELMGMKDESPSIELPKISATPELATIEVRDKTYTAFLSMLNLELQHVSDLKRRGLSIREIKKNGYRSVPQSTCQSICYRLIKDGHTLEGVPGFYVTRNGLWSCYSIPGYIIPVRDKSGQIQGLQVRVDNPKNGGKYRWFSVPDGKNSTPAQSWIHTSQGSSCQVWITEGSLKADIATYLSGHTFIGIAGVNAIKGLVPLLKDFGIREVVTAFDMDLLDNPHVRQALKRLQHTLKKAGVKTVTACWNSVMGKGIDDALLAGAQIEITGRRISLIKRLLGQK